MPEPIAYTFFATPWCELTVASSRRGLCVVNFGRSLARARQTLDAHWGETRWVESKSANRKVLEQLRAYFRGPPFQVRAWKALGRIPFGKTRSYRDVARAAGSPEASRAAGMACGSNRVALVVPCPRVGGADGSLTGFGGGLAPK